MQTLPSGFKTSEFIATLAAMITYMLVATGVLPSDKVGEVQEIILQSITGIVALGALISYILSRTELKKKQMEIAGPQVG